MVVRANNAAAAGSVGTVETQALDLPGPLALDCGRDFYPVRIAYETYGTHTADPDWQGGHYYGTGRAPTRGMDVARMVGHMMYLSAQSLGVNFDRRLQHGSEIRYVLDAPEFEIESYLRHQADNFVKRFDANTYLYTSCANSAPADSNHSPVLRR